MDPDKKNAALFKDAEAALRAGDVAKAVAIGKAMEKVSRKDPKTWLVLGRAYLAAMDYEKAAGYLVALHEREPENLPTRRGLTEIYCAVEYFEKAVAMYRPVFEQSARTYEDLYFFGGLCLKGGFEEEGLGCLDKAEKIRPGNPDLGVLRARGLIAMGDISAAGACTLEVLETDPENLEALILKADLGFDFKKPEIRHLEDLVGAEDLHPGTRADAGLALGKILASGGRYDDAFGAVKAANALLAKIFQDQGRAFDFAAEKATFRKTVSLYANPFIKTLAQPKALPVQPIFIIGLPRSGTTLVEQILGSHSKIARGGEIKTLGEFPILLEKLAGRQDMSSQQNLLVQNLSAWRRVYLQDLQNKARAGELFVTDKMPANYQHVGLAYALFPDARFIFLERDPLDNCLSMFFQPLASSYSASVSLEKLGEFYRLFQGYLAAWRNLEGLQFYDLGFEKMVRSPKAEIEKLIDFTGLPWEEACLDFHTSKGPVRTLSTVQVRQPLSEKSIGRWKHYRDHLKPLAAALKRNHNR